MTVRPHNPVGRLTAFTLMEVMIAMVAFAIVLTAINGVFYGAVQLRNRTVRSIDEAVGVQQALTLLQRDLANLVVPGGTLGGALQTTRTSAGTAGGSSSQGSQAGALASMTPVSQPGQGSPALHTSTGQVDETSPWGDTQTVTYYLSPSTNGSAGKDLIRAVTRNLLPTVQQQSSYTTLMGGLQSIFFLYHDGAQWLDTWDSTTQEMPLPRAIKVQLVLAAEPGRPAKPALELVVPIFAQGPTNQTSGTQSP